VLDVFARRVVGCSIAEHLRSEPVVDAMDMARRRREPAAGQTVVHGDHGSSPTGRSALATLGRTAGLDGICR
jgi:putative transposase